MSEKIYQFPVSNKFEARDVTEPDFDITEVHHWEETLMVELNDYRTAEKGPLIDFLEFQLNIENHKLDKLNDHHQKIIFSGHRGSGKTLELNRAYDYLNHPDRYFTIFIELEKEIPISNFEAEDFYVLLITKLAEESHKRGLVFKTDIFESLAKEWLSEIELASENTTLTGHEASIEAGVSIGIATFLRFGAKLKGIFASQSKESQIIREKIRNNPLQLIARLNNLFQHIRDSIKSDPRNPKGKDLLFILDGSEKADNNVYKQLFIDEQYLISQLQVNIIASVPIQPFYEIQYSSQQSEYTDYLMPMVDLTKDETKSEALNRLSEVVANRVQEEIFFEEGVLPFLTEKSGGSPRELLKIVNNCFQHSRGEKITFLIAEDVCRVLGKKMFDRLTSAHHEALIGYKDGKTTPADVSFREMLMFLFVLKSNGNIHVHPLLEPFLKEEQKF